MAQLTICDICKKEIDDGKTHGFIAALYEESWMENKSEDLCEDCLYKVLEYADRLEKEAQNENNP